MKKLKLDKLNLSNVEVLTREQLKEITGGLEAGTPPNVCYHGCDCGAGWPSFGDYSDEACVDDSDCSIDFTCSDGCTPYTKCG